MVDQHEGGHGFDDGDCSGEDAWVVTSAPDKFGFVAVDVHGVLRLEDGGGGLEGNAKIEFLSVAYSTLDAAGSIRLGAYVTVAVLEGVVVFGSLEQGARESAADLEPLGCGKREHGFGQIGFETVEDGDAESRGHSLNATAYQAADGVSRFFEVQDVGHHLFGCFWMRATYGRGVHFLQSGKILDLGRFDVVYPLDVGSNLDAGRDQDLLGDGPCSHATDGLARRRTTSALVVANAEFLLVGEVRVRRTKLFFHLVVGLRAGILVPYEHGDGGAEGDVLEHA